MDVVGESLHVGKFAVGVDDALRVALTLPGVVNVDVDVSGVAHAAGDHGIGGGAHIGIVDLAGEVVPAVPSHGRRGGEGGGLGGCERNVSGYQKDGKSD